MNDENLIDSRNIIITCGVKPSIDLIFRYLFNKGENIIIFTPCSSYYSTASKENEIETR